MPEDRDFKKKNISKEPKAARNIVPEIEDSSNLNLFIDNISRKNLVPLSEAINHSSDNSVKPIIGNKDI